jgi:hypothetical protein
MGDGISEVLATMGNNRLGGTDFDRRLADYICDLAVEYGRGTNNNNNVVAKSGTTATSIATTRRKATSKSSNNHIDNNELVRRNNESNEKRRQNNQSIIKNWYRFGTNEVSSIILRLAERIRICLSNQKSVQIILPLTENGWQRLMLSTTDNNNDNNNGGGDGVIIGPKFDKSSFESVTGMIEGNNYTIVTIDRKTFESVCINELNLLLQPLREVSIMARVMLPGEARPSYVENAMAELLDKGRTGDEDEDGSYNDENDFWKSDDDTETIRDDGDDNNIESQLQSEQAYQLLQAMNVKLQKKAQQKGRKMSRDIDKRERSFRKHKQTAAEEASMTLLLGKKGRSGGSVGGGAAAISSSQTTLTANNSGGSGGSNVRIQEGIHGRALSRVILVGGATRMPVISKLLEAVVGIVPQRTVNPDEAVALGCAVQVGILDGENDKLAVLSPMQAAVMRALAIKEQRRTANDNGLAVPTSGGRGRRRNDVLSPNTALEQGMDESMKEMITMGGMIVVDEFDDEDDFY